MRSTSALSFFLVKKLRGYADRLGLDRSQNWVVLDAKYTMLAERAKLSDPALSGLATVAQRIVTENTVFRFDGGEAAFAAAEKAEIRPNVRNCWRLVYAS